MRQVLIKTAVKGVIIFIGILIISTGLQLMTRVWGVEHLVSEVGGQMSEAYPGQNEEFRRQARDYFQEALGLDLWPFNNQSLWHRPEGDLE